MNQGNFVPYVCCGDPSIAFTEKLVKALAMHSGLIELGIPFSDPIADGPTIQAASQRALRSGVTTEDVFQLVGRLRKAGVRNDFALMTYYNIIFAYGRKKFLARSKESGVQALIIPDLPFGEDKEFEAMALEHGIHIIGMVAPNTTHARAKSIITAAGKSGAPFTYLVSAKGTTGAKKAASGESLGFVRRVRKIAGEGERLFVGFGISSAEQARAFMDAGASGVIVGSGITDIYASCTGTDGRIDEQAAVEKVSRFVREVAEAIAR